MSAEAYFQAQQDLWCRQLGPYYSVPLQPYQRRSIWGIRLVSTPQMRLGLVAARLRRMVVRDGVFYDPVRAARDVARAMMAGGWRCGRWR